MCNFSKFGFGLTDCLPIANFFKVKRANFTYESLFSSYILALNELSYEKRAHKTLMKLTPYSFLITYLQVKLFEALKYV